MSETLTVQVKEVRIKEGTNAKGKPWKSRLLVDSADDFIGSTFGGELDGLMAGQTLEVEREQNGDYWNIVKATPVTPPPGGLPAPMPGTGDYIKGKEAPETRAAIAAAVALDKAVVIAPLFDTITPASLLETADEFYDWLMFKSQAAAPEKPAQDVAEPSQEQRDELKAIVTKLNTMVPKQEGQKSWTEDLAYFAEHTFGKTGDLNRSEFQQLIDYGHGLERDQALPF